MTPTKLTGNRTRTLDDVWDGKAGDYFPVIASDGKVGRLFFKLPTGTLGSIAGKGYGQGDDPEWDITIEADGTVTVEPSIKQDPIDTVDPPIVAWHGHLKKGIWTW